MLTPDPISQKVLWKILYPIVHSIVGTPGSSFLVMNGDARRWLYSDRSVFIIYYFWHDANTCFKVIDSFLEYMRSNGYRDDRSFWITFLDGHGIILLSFCRLFYVASYNTVDIDKICSFKIFQFPRNLTFVGRRNSSRQLSYL
jgi:hypothetical protein